MIYGFNAQPCTRRHYAQPCRSGYIKPVRSALGLRFLIAHYRLNVTADHMALCRAVDRFLFLRGICDVPILPNSFQRFLIGDVQTTHHVVRDHVL